MTTTQQQLAWLVRLSEQLKVAQAWALALQGQRDALIVELMDSGLVTSSVIASHTGTSQPRIIQIRNRARERVGEDDVVSTIVS